MSQTLAERKRPKTGWAWHFKMGIRDKLYKKFGNNITASSITYLEGMRDSADEDDAAQIQGMIDALYDDYEIELEMQ